MSAEELIRRVGDLVKRMLDSGRLTKEDIDLLSRAAELRPKDLEEAKQGIQKTLELICRGRPRFANPCGNR
jgi:hypothetical protein